MNKSIKKVEMIFASPPTANQKACGLINDFCHIMLTNSSIKESELDISPDITVRELMKIADKYKVDIKLVR